MMMMLLLRSLLFFHFLLSPASLLDVNAQFQNALLLGDVPSRIRLLLSAGQVQLAYMTAITHGLEDMAEQIRAKLQIISGSDEPLGRMQ
jgi:hypothetical protein